MLNRQSGQAGRSGPVWVNGTVRPYVIAEAGVNHNGRRDLALALVDAAWQVGADCVKFQAYSADELVVKEAAKAEYQKSCGQAGESQYDMLLRYELNEEDFVAIMQRCARRGIDFLITPFSPRWVEFFVEQGVSAFKLGSGNVGAAALLQSIAHTRLPVIVSTGMSNLVEVLQTRAVLEQGGSSTMALMHCVSLYPSPLEKINLYAMHTLAEETGLPVGFSDHTQEVITGGWAVAAGAKLLEKHFTLDKTLEGPDHAMSLNVNQMRQYIVEARRAARACGPGGKEPLPEEKAIKDAVRMSAVSTVPITAGTVLTREMLTEKRPGTGIPAERIDQLVGLKVLCNIAPNQIVQPDWVETAMESFIS